MGQLIHLVTSALGFKARVDSLACFLASALFLRFISGVTPADLLTPGMVARHIPYMLSSAEVGCQIRTGDLPSMHRFATYSATVTVNVSVINCGVSLEIIPLLDFL